MANPRDKISDDAGLQAIAEAGRKRGYIDAISDAVEALELERVKTPFELTRYLMARLAEKFPEAANG